MGGIGFLPLIQAATSLVGAFMGGGGSAPSAPPVPQAPPPPTKDDEEVRAKREAERQRVLKQRGIGSTRVTGPLGLQPEEASEVKTEKKTLLGD
jgi:hypothetical protein